MFGLFKRKKKVDDRFSQPLSPEADKFLAEALEEYGRKEEALEKEWCANACAEYALNQDTGLFHIKLEDGRTWEADAQILGSYNEDDQTWQWAWGNPHCAEIWSRDSKIVRETGKRLGVWYLHELPGQPMPGPEFVAYFCAIGMKASDSPGMFEARDGSVVIFVMLKNLRWVDAEAHASAAASVREKGAGNLTSMIREIKAGRDEILPSWIELFGRSEVHVISIDKNDPSRLFVIGPKDDKNYIAVFTDEEGLKKAVANRGDVLFPITINGKVLLQQAKDAGRGLIINPTDEAASVPLPAQMMSAFLEAIA
jgi:hypothetical protein